MKWIIAVSLSGVGLANLPLLAQPVSPAGLPPSGTTNRAPYRTRVERVDGPGLLPADFAYVTLGTNKFGFVMPEGFRLETQDAQKVTLVNRDFNCLLTFRLLETGPGGKTEPDAAYYRELLLNRRPGGTILEEFSLVAASRRGPAFELRWNADRTVPRRERVLFIPWDAGVLEFSLISSLEKFETGRQAFSSFLLTFRTPEADGRLIMPVLSNRL